MKTRTFIAGIAALFLATGTAQAADAPIMDSLTGEWCQKKDENYWRYFERRNKCGDTHYASLVLKQNGDYVYTLVEGPQERCKADRKTYFKGWMDYSCTAFGRTRKKHQKFLVDTDTGELMQSYED